MNPEIDRVGWPSGPWDNEPDFESWFDPDSGLDCVILRARLGMLCGYVGVPEGHDWFEKDYDDIDVDVHGGLTWANGNDEYRSHGQPRWWVGFNAGHLWDLVPGLRPFGEHGPNDVYRDIEFIRSEVSSLALQAKNVGAARE